MKKIFNRNKLEFILFILGAFITFLCDDSFGKRHYYKATFDVKDLRIRNETIKEKAYSSSPVELNNVISSMLSMRPLDFRIIQLMKDIHMPLDLYEKFAMAIHGDQEAIDWINENDKDQDYSDADYMIFEYANVENECYYNIGILYYNDDKNMSFEQDKEKALYWLKKSAEKGSFLGAISAGDMLLKGDGISINKDEAFGFYEKALKNKISGIAYERLAGCYEKGIGTNIDKKKAKEYYFKSTLDGNPQG